jgi:hypothetical protein
MNKVSTIATKTSGPGCTKVSAPRILWMPWLSKPE